MADARTAHRPIAALQAIGLAVLLSLAIACGSETPDDSAPITEEEAKAATDRYLQNTFGFYTGDASVADFIESYAPECRSETDVATLEFMQGFIQTLAPELQEMNLEEVDVGSITMQQTDDGALVQPSDPGAMQVKVDGRFLPAKDIFAELGFEDLGEEDADPIRLVRRAGTLYVADCEGLQAIGLE